MNVKKIGIALALVASIVVAGCGEESSQSKGNESRATVSIGEQVDYQIIGIEPGAGVTQVSKNALNEYKNLDGWELVESSTAGMLSSLKMAIQNEEPIIITGWTPHWKFSAYDLKLLEDPKGVLGGLENINTLVRKGLEKDMPEAYTILDRFYWEPEDMEAVMYDAQSVSFEDAAMRWIENNQDRVKEWTEDLAKVNGESFELVSVPWDSERASSSVMKALLEQIGYNVTVTPVDPAIMFQAVANGEADATLAPWLPTTHRSFYEQIKDDVIDLGANLKGTKIGFVVPTYVEIDSIEELQPKK